MPARFRGALLTLPVFLLVACGGGSSTSSVNPTANDPKPTTSSVSADFDPSTGNIPLPNVLATAATTATLTPTAHVPFTPPQALVWLNQQEAGNTNAVSGLNAPFYLSFSGQVDPNTVNASTVKVFLAQPDTASPSSTENNPLGFVDVSAQFSYQVLPSGKEIYVMPKVPMLPASRYVYVATNGVHDMNGIGIGSSLVFGIEKYVKGGATSYATDTTNLGDLTDTSNPATVLGQSTASLLESIAGNSMVSSQIAFSGFRKTMWDLIAASATTGITSRAQIAVLGRTITNATGYTLPNPASLPTTRMPLETLLWGWANNANLGATDFSNANARQWNNDVANFAPFATAGTPTGGQVPVSAVFGTIPHSHVALVCWGSYESGDLQMDPATVQAHLAVAGGNEDANSAYYPGTSTAPGTGTMMAFRSGTGQLFGYYHQTRQVPFILVIPTGTVPASGWPVVIFEHGIGGSKEQALGMADTAASAGYATIAIDQAVHGYAANGTTDATGATISGSLTPSGVPGMGNSRPSAEWASNFFMLPSSLTARANLYTSAFHLWRLERILNQPAADASSLAGQLSVMTGATETINTGATTHKFVGQSLGSIVGTIFLAGNSSQTGGSNMPGFLSVPGARLGFVLHDSPAFQSAVNAGLAANGVPTGSPAYNQFFVAAQSIADSADPASMLTPLPGQTSSRLAGRVAMQEAVGDQVIPNAEGNYWANALGGRKPQFGADVSGGFSPIRNDGDADVALPFMFGGGLGDYTTLKATVAAAIPTVSATPTQGVFQFGTPAAPAAHGLLLQDTTTPVNVVRAQAQMAYWLKTGTIADGHTVSGQIAPPPSLPGAELFGPESLHLFFPKAQ
jgi:hypothetical protein